MQRSKAEICGTCKFYLDGREYVDKESFKELIVQKIISEIKDSESQDERTGLEMCIQIIGNL